MTKAERLEYHRKYSKKYFLNPINKLKAKTARAKWKKTRSGIESLARCKIKYRLTAHGREMIKKDLRNHFKRPLGVFSLYKNSAKTRGIFFKLSFNNFMRFWGAECSYCNSPIERIGLDRVNNSIGYIISNITPCCTPCNWMKRGYTKEFFINHCKKVANSNGGTK